MAGGGKISPRQKMINMMYLVLTALLALNVSKEILKSFHLFEQSFIAAAKNIDSKNTAVMNSFAESMKDKPDRTRPYFERAKLVQQEAAKFQQYINDVRAQIEKMYDGRKDGDPNGEMLAPDQMEKHARYFTENNKAKGKELQDAIKNAAINMIAVLKPDPKDTGFKIDPAQFNNATAANQLKAEDPPKKGTSQEDWVNIYLEHQPAGGLMAILSRIQNDAKTLESDVLDRLLTGIDAGTFKFDKLEAKVMASSNYVMEGESYEADILLVASASNADFEVKVRGNSINMENGIGKFSEPASGVGVKSFSGEIIVKGGPNGDESFAFDGEYQVFKPAATIAATEMNLLYVGLDNPMSISVPGFSASDVKVSTSGGLSLTSQAGGKYNAKVDGSANEVTITASITKDGKTRTVGSEKFRVRRLPQPTGQLGGLPNDGIPKPKAQVQAQTNIFASMGPSFAYNLTYRVNGFRFIFAPGRRPATQFIGNGSALTNEMRSAIAGAQSGDRIIIEGIKVTEAKYGFSNNLPPIVITIQ
jgi:gliding motility-associated protein GldM